MIRDHITGTHTREQLDALTRPIAWSPFKSPADAADEEAALSELAAEAREALEADPDAVAVEIRAGQVVATVRA